MTISQMECFLEIAKTGSFSKAAEQLFITQQGASNQIKTLERELGFSLFVRSSTGTRLTDEGKMLIKAWTEAIDTIKISTDKARDYYLGREKVLRIALEDMGNVTEQIVAAFSEYEKKYDDLTIDFQILLPKQIRALFAENKVDFAIVYEDEFSDMQNISHLPLHENKLKVHAVLGKDHPLSKEQFDLDAFLSQPIGVLSEQSASQFRHIVDRFFTQMGRKPPARYKEYSSRRELEVAIVANRCVSIVYETVFQDEEDKLFMKDLHLEPCSTRIAIFWKNEDNLIKARALTDLLREKLHRI